MLYKVYVFPPHYFFYIIYIDIGYSEDFPLTFLLNLIP